MDPDIDGEADQPQEVDERIPIVEPQASLPNRKVEVRLQDIKHRASQLNGIFFNFALYRGN